MITDKEILSINQDKLDFKAYVEALAEIIIESDTPLTIGVYGEWGTGKTSLMRMTEASLNKNKSIRAIWFDAWKYDKVEDLRVALIFTIMKTIEEDSKTSVKLREKTASFLKRIHWMEIAKNVSKLGLSFISPYLSQFPILNLSEDQVKPQIDLANILPNELINTISLESLKFLHEFESLYKDIITKYIGNEGKLVVFIDDLDRCLPDKAIDILESVKLFLSIEGAMFVIGIDQEIVTEGIKIKYPIKEKGDDTWAINYLEKIIQLPFRLPPLRKETIAEKYISNITSLNNKSDENDNLAKIFAEVGGNPRTVKRVVNNYKLQKKLAQKRALNIDDLIIAKFIVLEFRWPAFYKDFIHLYSNNNINIMYLLSDKESNFSIVNKYNKDDTLLEFIRIDPDFRFEITNLDNYIHLARTNIQLKEDYNETYNAGITYIELEDYKNAIIAFSKAIILKDNSLEAYFYRAISYLNVGNLESFESDIKKCDSYISSDYENIFTICEYLISNNQHSKAKIYNDKLLLEAKYYNLGLENILKIPHEYYSDKEIINAACYLLRHNGYKDDYYSSLRTRYNDICDLSNIDACVIIIKAGILDYRLIEHCVKFYIKNSLLEKAADLYALEASLQLRDTGECSFLIIHDAIRTSGYAISTIKTVVQSICLHNLSFDFFKYLMDNYQSDVALISTIEHLIDYLVTYKEEYFFDKVYALGEIKMKIDDIEIREYLESNLELFR